MSTRGRIARGEHQQEFEGHVQRWVKQWEPLGGTSKVKILKWVPTGDRSEAPATSRVPHLKTVRDSSLKVVLRPKQAPRPQEQPQTAQDVPSSNGTTKLKAEQLHHASADPDAAVPMEIETGKADNVPEQSPMVKQQSLPRQEGSLSGEAATKQSREDVPDELQAATAVGSAHEPDRALAEKAAEATLAALSDGAAAHPTSASAEHATASRIPEEQKLPMAARAEDTTLAGPQADSSIPTDLEAGTATEEGRASKTDSAENQLSS